ncbi:MAG: ribosome maturation factor RimM [Gammaproteobacteria bacterium]|nr:ribosome maturation factor RimM [Gammaproteobacteria bacterium]MBT8150115.1 ribosome maturation factor RimM [Gammaproteobacteria bacterium]NNL11813.1 16S rRNA processing protein RimM [Pseudomonadales bacterium]NNM12291.1 16S rRNA processing protein RimM [Pseudomonadales bacterium]
MHASENTLPADQKADQNDWLVVGRLKSVFGVKGWIKLESFTEPADNIFSYTPWRLVADGKSGKSTSAREQRLNLPLSIEPESVEARANEFVIKLKGFENREQVAKLAGLLLEVPRQSLPAADDGEYYWHQLEGLDVYRVVFADDAADGLAAQGANAEQQHMQQRSVVHIGRVDHLMETGANDVLVVRGTEEILIPYLPGSVVKDVDLQRGRIVVDWQIEAEN